MDASMTFKTGASQASQQTQRIQEKPELPKADLPKPELQEPDTGREEIREDVIAVSKDGDTVQASLTSRSKLEQEDEMGGRVIAKNNSLAEKSMPTASDATKMAQQRIQEQVEDSAEASDKREEQQQAMEVAEAQRRRAGENERQERAVIAENRQASRQEREEKEAAADEERKENSSKEISSYAGYSNSELKQMYLEGDISRQEYEKELSQRKDQQQPQASRGASRDGNAAQARESAAFGQDMADNLTARRENSFFEEELRGLGNEEEAQTLDSAERKNILDAAQQTGQNQDPFANVSVSTTSV